MVIVKCSVAVPPQRIARIQVRFALNLHCAKYALSRIALVRISDDNDKTENGANNTQMCGSWLPLSSSFCFTDTEVHSHRVLLSFYIILLYSSTKEMGLVSEIERMAEMEGPCTHTV